MEIPKITRASFLLTRSCNLTCPFCFTNGCTRGSMSLDIAKRGVDFLFKGASQCQGADRQVEISFWGGEPLLKWDLMKALTLYAEDASKKSAIPVSFGGTTNGTLLTPEKFDFLDEHRIFFMMSIDGAQKSHDTFRKFKSGKGSHSVVMKNAEAVLERWPFYRTRLSPTAERIDHFFEDMKYLFDFGFNYIMFSPVYEGIWTEERWETFEDQCYKLIDYMKELKDQGRKVEIEHFKSYIGKDNSERPCGAGVHYCNIDIDGSIEVCHRFLKFDDPRPWQEREYCIGHIDFGITRPEVREKFIHPDHSLCGACERLNDTPCHGSCPALNYDFTGSPFRPAPLACRYVEMQKRVSNYYKEKIMDNEINQNGSCECNMTNYCGPIDPAKLPKSNVPDVTLNTMMALLQDMNKRLMRLER